MCLQLCVCVCGVCAVYVHLCVCMCAWFVCTWSVHMCSLCGVYVCLQGVSVYVQCLCNACACDVCICSVYVLMACACNVCVFAGGAVCVCTDKFAVHTARQRAPPPSRVSPALASPSTVAGSVQRRGTRVLWGPPHPINPSLSPGSPRGRWHRGSGRAVQGLAVRCLFHVSFPRPAGPGRVRSWLGGAGDSPRLVLQPWALPGGPTWAGLGGTSLLQPLVASGAGSALEPRVFRHREAPSSLTSPAARPVS